MPKKSSQWKRIFKKAPPAPTDDMVRRWVKKRFNEALKYFLIDYVKLTIQFDDQSPYIDGEPAQRVVFNTKYTRRYHRASITAYLPSVSSMYRTHREDLVEGIFHEIAHIHTTESDEIAQRRIISSNELRESNESLTEIIAQYVIRDVRNRKEFDNLLKD